MANPSVRKEIGYALRRYRGGFVVQQTITTTRLESGEIKYSSGPIMPPEWEPVAPLDIEVDPLGLTADELGECLQFMNEGQVQEWRAQDPRKGAYFGKYMARFRDFNKADDK